MPNRGDYRHYIEIWSKVDLKDEDENPITDELGEIMQEAQKVGETFARIDFRGGGLLSGRSADTVMSKVTHKFSFPYGNFSERLQNSKHWIMYQGRRHDIEYAPDCFNGVEVEVFTSEKI